MKKAQLTNILLDQSKDLVWVINSDYQLVYANKSYLSVVKMVTGKEQKINESAFIEGIDEDYFEKWKAYYNRGLKGEYFQIEEHHYNSERNETRYGHVTFEPLIGDDNKVFAVACQSKDVTDIVKQRFEASQLIDASLDVFCTVNEEGNFVYLSAAAATHWGYLPEELIGTPYVNLILEEDIPKSKAMAAEILSGNDTKSFINRYKKKDGSIAYNLWSIRWDESTRLMYCVVRDAKETIEQEEKILQSEQRFKTLVQEGSDLIGILDKEGNYTYVSPTSIGVLGIAPEEFIGRNVLEFIHPDDQERVLSPLKEIVSKNKVIIAPFRFQNHKKEWRWIETVLTNMLENPAVRGIVANSRDITDEIEEKQKLKLLESVITNTSDAVLITEAEPQGEPGPRIIYVNEAFTKMTGYTSEEVIGKSPRFLQGPNSNKEELAKLGNALRNWQPYEITTINYKKNGEEFWVNFTVTPVANENGWYMHWIAIERDVTEQKNKELENSLLAQISSNFNLENDYGKASSELCRTIGIFGSFDLVELWTVNLEKTQIHLISHYLKNPKDNQFFSNAHKVLVLQKTEGLLGKAWANNEQLLWGAEEKHDDFIKKDEAKKLGLKAVLGIPLVSNNVVVGVLAIGTKNDEALLKKYANVFDRLREFIGTELSRKTLENDLNYLFDTLPDMVSVGDFSGRFLTINKAGCKLMGYTEEEILEQPFEKFIHPDDLDIAHKELGKLNQGPTTLTFEVRFITKSGSIIWLSWYCTPNLNEGLIYSTAKNITEEKKLRELNRQSRLLARIGSWEIDLINQSIYWSDEVHLLHETDPKTFVPNFETGINFYRQDFHELVRSSIEKSISTGETFDFEAVLVTANKKERWVRSIGDAEIIDGKCKRIYGSFQDIDSRKQAEVRLQTLASNLPGVAFQYLLYPDGKDELKYVTKGAQQVWGFPIEELHKNIQLVWDGIKVGGEFNEVKRSITNSIQFKTKWTCRFKYVMPSGELRTHFGSGTPTFLADGTVLFNSIVLDVTQEAQNEELLKQTAQVARMGSWEMDLISNEGGGMYWSPIIFEILELDDSYNPSITGGIEFHDGESKERIMRALDLLIKEGTEFDEELLLITAKGNKRWCRAIGKSEMANNLRTRIYGSYQDIHQLKTTNENLKKAFNEKNIILESIGDAFFAVDTEWTVTYWNKEAESFLGMKREDIVGKYLWDPYKDAIDTDFYRQYHIAMNTHEVIYFEEYYPTLDKWFDVSVYPSLEGLSIYFKDITAKKKTEQEKKRLQTTLESSLNEIYIFDANTLLFSYVNKSALLNLGYSDQEIKALTPIDLKPEFTTVTFKQLITNLVNHKKEKIVFFTNHKRKDGSLYPVEVHLQLVEEGDNKRFIAVILDITERRKAEESIILANERFKKVTQATNDLIWDWDIINDTFYRSEAIEQFFGDQASKSFGENDFWKDSFHPDDKEKIQKSVEEAIADPLCHRWKQEYRLFSESGKLQYVIDQGIIIRDKDGKAIRMVGAMTDVTERKHMELQLSELNQSLQQYTLELERSNEELEHFAFVASHDLQEPLRMVSSFMDLLKLKYGDKIDEKGHQYIHFATDGAKRMKQIILDLLEYSRASRPTEGKEEVNLNEVLSDFEQLRSKLLSEKSGNIKSNKLPTLNTYKAAITQILHCLIDNALKYSKEDIPPIIEIKSIEKETEWKFSIKDNGIGIEPQFYEKIFIIFHRLHNKDKYTGTGIGLSIAKRHVEFLGGQIWLESVPGEGTVFYFTIPKTK